MANNRTEFYKQKRKYLSKQVYQVLLEKQGGVCAICGQTQTSKHKYSLDHDHDTGQFRGLVCKPCNSALGRLERDWDKFQAFLVPERVSVVDKFIREFPKYKYVPKIAIQNRAKTRCHRGHKNWKVDVRGHRYCYTCARLFALKYKEIARGHATERDD